MKKLLLLSAVIVMISSMSVAQKIFKIPESGEAIVNINVPTSKWSVTNKDGMFSLIPKDDGETSRLVTMIWASDNPSSETAIDDIAEDAFAVVESLLVDITWNEDLSEFENNGISYVANDGYGYYVNDDGSKDQMSTTIMLLMPDDKNVLALVFFGTSEAYDKWQESLLEVILSMTPVK